MRPDHLVKVLAEHGVASRRGSEKMIRAGEVAVDGETVTDPAALVDPRAQRVTIGDEDLPPRPAPQYLVLHKPAGVITSRADPDGRKTVFDLVGDDHPSLAAVGRLDYGTEGVLVLTNDGELAYRLTHPSYGVSKSYLAKVSGTPDESKLARLTRGVMLEDGPSGPALVEMIRSSGPSSWILLTTRGGRNRIVRRMLEHIGHRVLKLKRVGFGGITLRGLRKGQSRALTDGELQHVRRLVRSPGKGDLWVSHQVRIAVAESLRMPPPERTQVKGRDDEGRPFRKKGWARPKPKRKKHGRKRGQTRGSGGPTNKKR